MTCHQDNIRGLILGVAVGDALGLPAEGLKPRTIKQLGWTNWKHRFFFGKGMVSDDTDHTFFVAQALLSNPDGPQEFKKSMAWKLRWWLLGIPAGIGFGTLRAILKLWFFVPLSKCGVWSAGNGPAMRSAIIGARFADNKELLNEFVKSSTELTHTDPKALTGALAVSHAAVFALKNTKENTSEMNEFFETLYSLSKDDKEWQDCVQLIESSLKNNLSVSEFVNNMNLNNGISGYIYHTVPVALYAWLRHYGDFKTTLTEVLNCGGDTDTVGAITGALAGTTVGEEGIPKEWIDRIIEWPRSTKILRKAADAIATKNTANTEMIKYFWPGIIIRNIFQLIVVLGHVALRLVPIRLRRSIGI